MAAPDIDSSNYDNTVTEDLRWHSNAAQEHEGNVESQSNLVNHAGGMKFAKEDAIEAASAEMILQLNS